MSNKRRASDNGPRKYLQWVPIALVVFGVIGSWFTLNERVNAGETSMERNEKMDDQQQQFILEHERRIQEGRDKTCSAPTACQKSSRMILRRLRQTSRKY